MEGYEALKNADEVRTFPTIAMPPPVFKIHTGKGNHPRGKDIQVPIYSLKILINL